MEFQFKKDYPDVEKRKNQCKILLIKEPTKIPVILEKDPNSKLEAMNKTKHLILKKLTVNKFQLMIKNLLKMPEEDALFLSIRGKYTIIGEKTMADIYEKYKDKEDGFLYIMYSSEVIYG